MKTLSIFLAAANSINVKSMWATFEKYYGFCRPFGNILLWCRYSANWKNVETIAQSTINNKISVCWVRCVNFPLVYVCGHVYWYGTPRIMASFLLNGRTINIFFLLLLYSIWKYSMVDKKKLFLITKIFDIHIPLCIFKNAERRLWKKFRK